jgi:hypothetical protein
MITNKYNNINTSFITIILAIAIIWFIYYFTPHNNFYFYNTK